MQKLRGRELTALEFMLTLHDFCHFPSREKRGVASKSEIRRWFERKSIHINGRAYEMTEEVTEVRLLVLHPKGKSRTTVWDEE